MTSSAKAHGTIAPVSSLHFRMNGEYIVVEEALDANAADQMSCVMLAQVRHLAFDTYDVGGR